jgi:hypothetical protein
MTETDYRTNATPPTKPTDAEKLVLANANTHRAVAFVVRIATYALMVKFLWAWFLVPLHVPAIQFWHAMGLYLLAENFPTRSGFDSKATLATRERAILSNPEEAVSLAWQNALLLPGVAIALGWAMHMAALHL